ncbi:MAG: outer membrane protein assembly factor BamE [Betaproteobacteria bacterium]|nr:outer membrane protein assembly factor BamE [Betaproteobacteria bacterium]MDE2310849.1 outer membrane protein assembly factor BamE [Betaproteobacteria bacterium]
MRTKLIVVSLLLASCSDMSMPKLALLTPHKIEIRQGNMVTPEMREKLKTGMSRLQVRSVLGTPLINDPFHASRWDYVYRLEQKGKLVEQQRLTLYFDEDRLARIDESSMPPQSAPPPQEGPAAQSKMPVPVEPDTKK